MKTTYFVRSISSKLSMGRRSRAVAPLFEQSRFSEEVTAKLNGLGTMDCGVSSSWLVDVLDAVIATQVVARDSLVADEISFSGACREMIDDYLEDNVELLDACNGLVEKMEMVQKYVDLLKTTIHLVDSGRVEPSVATLVRTQETLKECNKIEAQCATLDKCSPKLNKLMGQKTIHQMGNIVQEGQELSEVLSGSKEVASMGCHLLQRALSFKSRQGSMKMRSKLPTTWSISLNELQSTMNSEAERRKKGAPWMMKELEVMVTDAKMLHDQVKSEKRNVDIDSLKRSCEALEEGILPLEERVRELYKHLISIRMILLGVLSQA